MTAGDIQAQFGSAGNGNAPGGMFYWTDSTTRDHLLQLNPAVSNNGGNNSHNNVNVSDRIHCRDNRASDDVPVNDKVNLVRNRDSPDNDDGQYVSVAGGMML